MENELDVSVTCIDRSELSTDASESRVQSLKERMSSQRDQQVSFLKEKGLIREDYGLGAPSPLLCRLPPLFGRATKCPRSLRKQRKQPAGCFRKQQNHPLETTVTTVTTRVLWPLWPLFLFCFHGADKAPASIRLPFAIDGFERRAEYRSSSSPIVWERSWLCCCGQVAIRGRFSIVFGRRFFRRFLPNPWCIIDVASSKEGQEIIAEDHRPNHSTLIWL